MYMPRFMCCTIENEFMSKVSSRIIGLDGGYAHLVVFDSRFPCKIGSCRIVQSEKDCIKCKTCQQYFIPQMVCIFTMQIDFLTFFDSLCKMIYALYASWSSLVQWTFGLFHRKLCTACRQTGFLLKRLESHLSAIIHSKPELQLWPFQGYTSHQ